MRHQSFMMLMTTNPAPLNLPEGDTRLSYLIISGRYERESFSGRGRTKGEEKEEEEREACVDVMFTYTAIVKVTPEISILI